MKYKCEICTAEAESTILHCRESMYGWGDAFDYFQCSICGCLQAASVPLDLSRFYPTDYYSFQVTPLTKSGWRSRCASQRDNAAASGRGFVGKVLELLIPARSDVKSLAAVPARSDMRVLDVGCGGGQLLAILHRAGFGHLTGIDPFLPENKEPVRGVALRKQSLQENKDEFDLIMMHHVFEHLPAGLETLIACRDRLSEKGKLLLRFPCVDSYAFEIYGENWVQIDAPRHLFLHSQKSFRRIADSAGLKIEHWSCDSSAFQFWGSELYKRGVSLMDADGSPRDLSRYFSKEQMRSFAKRARGANRRNRGDQIVTVLTRT